MGSFLDKPIEKHEVHGPDEGNGQVAAMACMQGWRVDMEVRGGGSRRGAHFFLPTPTHPSSAPCCADSPFFPPTPTHLHFLATFFSQDAHTVEVSVPRKPEYSFYAVFDGHGGSYIAMVAAKKLLDCIMDQPAFERVDESIEFLKTAMIEGFKTLDHEMRQVRLCDAVVGHTAGSREGVVPRPFASTQLPVFSPSSFFASHGGAPLCPPPFTPPRPSPLTLHPPTFYMPHPALSCRPCSLSATTSRAAP
jgi:hypothetical protein